VLNGVEASQKILNHCQELLKQVAHFISGYFYYHLSQGRYRLKELDLPFDFACCGTSEEAYSVQ
jgi:hypothetical protein